MARAALAPKRQRADQAAELSAALNALSAPIVVIEADRRISWVNQAAEQFFESGAAFLTRLRLDDVMAHDHPLFSLLDQVRTDGSSVSEYGVTIETPRIGQHQVTIEASAMPERPGSTVVMLHRRSIAQKIDRQLVHRNAARSVTAMAAMLAHEVKNPLSGIRGAAQLLEQSGRPEDRELTRLIIDETDRICALVDRMEVFSDQRPIDRQPVNIHEVMERVRRSAQSGFARHVRFIERYDPSLPPALGNRDLLIQVFLNLVKNAAEAVPAQGGEIVLATAYQHGVRLAVPGSDVRTHLPLLVSVQDNGDGIPEDLRPHLFDPFVTTKVNGTGLGLALVAKIVGDHGGVIEFDSHVRRTVFRVLLPVHAVESA
ncbi:MAG: PAS domain-containing protein [Alphaproteobacteria bacterium]|nr:PAS domain-containing protein [Alphaproteobacteria bacterium]